jgi:hypothetical protein
MVSRMNINPKVVKKLKNYIINIINFSKETHFSIEEVTVKIHCRNNNYEEDIKIFCYLKTESGICWEKVISRIMKNPIDNYYLILKKDRMYLVGTEIVDNQEIFPNKCIKKMKNINLEDPDYEETKRILERYGFDICFIEY